MSVLELRFGLLILYFLSQWTFPPLVICWCVYGKHVSGGVACRPCSHFGGSRRLTLRSTQKRAFSKVHTCYFGKISLQFSRLGTSVLPVKKRREWRQDKTRQDNLRQEFISYACIWYVNWIINAINYVCNLILHCLHRNHEGSHCKTAFYTFRYFSCNLFLWVYFLDGHVVFR